MKIVKFFSPRATLVALIISVPILGIIDYATSYDLGFFVFYFLPISIGAWRLGPRYACLLSVLSAIAWGLSDWYSGHTYSHMIYYAWNTIIRLISFLIIGYILAQIHKLLIEERKISKDLQAALDQVKTLSGLLPICAWCKRIRNDAGYWQQIEEYVKTHSDIQFSHGLCKDCAEKMKEDETSPVTSKSANAAKDKGNA
jgi:hypothetical protein